jgi:hypothetical protein
MKVLVDFVRSVVALTNNPFSDHPLMLDVGGAAEVAEAVTLAVGGASSRMYYMADSGQWRALSGRVEGVTWGDDQALRVRAVFAADASRGQGASQLPSSTSSGEHRGTDWGGRSMHLLTRRIWCCMRADFLAPLRCTWGAFPFLGSTASATSSPPPSPMQHNAGGDDGILLIVDSNTLPPWTQSNAGMSRRPGHS